MKNIFSSIRMSVIPASCFVLATVLLAACSKFDDDDKGDNTPVAGLMAFNLAPDQGAVAIALSGNNLTNEPLAYTNYTGTYQRVFTGSRDVESYDYSSDSTLSKVNFNFEADKYYSLFVVGTNGVYTNILTHDNFDSLNSTSGKAYIRYINAIPDSTIPTVTVSANGTNVISTPAGFASVSEFTATDPGDITVSVKNNSTIDANRSFSLEQGNVYTVLLTAIPGATDSTKTVQIKYILNGSLSGQ